MPIVRIAAAGRVFEPSWIMTVLTIALCALFVSLGQWQWQRGTWRQAQWEHFEQGSGQAVPLGSRGMDEVERFRRIRVTGRYDVARQVLLDNRSHEGRPGYEVLTPLRLSDDRIVLVNRGWVPFTGYRDRLPDIGFRSEGTVTVTGRTDNLPVAGFASGAAEPAADGAWPKVASFPTVEELSAVYGQTIEPRVLLLDAEQPNGYVREWQPPGMPPARHFSYAVQWWSFAALAGVLWIVLSTRRVREQS